jgi:5-methylcytosine-specific restriction enzyme subunit McrC
MHKVVREWQYVKVGEGENAFSRAQANKLITAAKQHPIGGEDGGRVLTDHYHRLRAQQIVGVVAAADCSLEILPKVDAEDLNDESETTLRSRLISLLNLSLNLKISDGDVATLARQRHCLLDILIRLFADRLLRETRRGLARQYVRQEDALPELKGQLDVVQQFSVHAGRIDRLACRFDVLSVDIPLMQVMKACVVFLSKHARHVETKRRLAELRFVLEDVSNVPPRALRWSQIRVDRNNHRWQTLMDMARLFLNQDWQATHHQTNKAEGISLLFPMNALFESTVAAILRKALAPFGFEVVSQGGFRRCLGEWNSESEIAGSLFSTRPDLIVKRHGEVVAIVDAKWKCIGTNVEDPKRGITQADVYQMMAYAQLYQCNRLVLLYPHNRALESAGLLCTHGIAVQGRKPADRLDVATIDISQSASMMVEQMQQLILGLLEPSSKRDVEVGAASLAH